ncbi:MAG: ATP-binding protein [Candidatus Pacearchaeota archaeon]|nr:ATP-binding protein [Candidatus Pacearchaeota archaeon]
MTEKSFKNRVKELALLNELFEKGTAKLIILYGRRRVGKTELLRQFLEKHKGLYILARQESDIEQLKKISSQIAEFYNDDVLKLNPFASWDALFTYLSEKPRIPIVFDEFPYIVQSNKQAVSILQDYWDNKFSKKDSFIVLCGSSINMMEKLLGKKSPIYGRRTEQILLEPLKFRDACLFFPEKMSLKDKVVYYSILGGMPAYLLEFDFNRDLKENIIENIVRKNKFLYQDVLFSLREELKEPRNYFSILYSIAKGNSKSGQIVNDTGLEKSFVNKYLGVLIDLQLVERRVPITEKKSARSRSGVYLVKDNFFKFWFKFIFENQEYIEQEKQEKLVDERILPELNAFAGRIFEEVALSEITRSGKYKDYLFGRWWDRNSEADLVGLDRLNRRILIGEVKFKKLSRAESLKIKSSLEENAKKINTFGFEQKLAIVCLDCDYEDPELEIIKLDKI